MTTLILVLALLGAAAGGLYVVKRRGGNRLTRRPRADLTVRTSVKIGGRWHIALVDVPGSTLVVGATEHGLTLLTILPTEDANDYDMQEALAQMVDPVHMTEPQPAPVAQEPTTAPRTNRPTTKSFFDGLLDDLDAHKTSETQVRTASAGRNMSNTQANRLRERLARYKGRSDA